jgi:hypothetical protein
VTPVSASRCPDDEPMRWPLPARSECDRRRRPLSFGMKGGCHQAGAVPDWCRMWRRATSTGIITRIIKSHPSRLPVMTRSMAKICRAPSCVPSLGIRYRPGGRPCCPRGCRGNSPGRGGEQHQHAQQERVYTAVFTSPDPQDLNPYAYAEDGAPSAEDPTGACPQQWVGGSCPSGPPLPSGSGSGGGSSNGGSNNGGGSPGKASSGQSGSSSGSGSSGGSSCSWSDLLGCVSRGVSDAADAAACRRWRT